MKRLVFVPPLTSVGAKIIDSRSWATLSIDRMSWRIDQGDIWILTGFCATISAVQKIQYLWKKMCGLDKNAMFSYLYHSPCNQCNLTFSAPVPYNLRLYCYCCEMIPLYVRNAIFRSIIVSDYGPQSCSGSQEMMICENVKQSLNLVNYHLLMIASWSRLQWWVPRKWHPELWTKPKWDQPFLDQPKWDPPTESTYTYNLGAISHHSRMESISSSRPSKIKQNVVICISKRIK